MTPHEKSLQKSPYRTHRVAELDRQLANETVRLAGFVHKKRVLGNVLFLELRDAGALMQCVVESDNPAFAAAEQVRVESVVSLSGLCALRRHGTENPDLASGSIELRVASLEVLSPAEPLPFPIANEANTAEELRLRYRFLDLRRDRLRKNLLLRSRLISRLRELLQQRGFVEFQTPILTSSSPEGARDFLVPSRLHPGKFYALPQAPQLFKQLLMVAGFDRYFQIAPCFRDEDARRDRSPGEFYQLDIEMAFVDQEQVFETIEPVMVQVFSELGHFPVPAGAFPRIPYREALTRYGSDKPDLRNPLELCDVSAWWLEQPLGARSSEHWSARALRAPAAATRSRKFFDSISELARASGARLVSHVALGEPARGPLVHAGCDVHTLAALVGAGLNDAIFVVAAPAGELDRAAHALRTQAATALGLVETNTYRFAWIVDFPMYERNPETQALQFSHNPFSMPQGGLEALAGDPERVLAHQYDLVVNGVELSSGAIRNHSPEIMLRAFELAGYGPEEVERRFGGLLSAFRFGAPPHGGLAPGVDRMLMLLADESNLREVIAFPLTQNGEDLLMRAPSPVDDARLRELHLKP